MCKCEMREVLGGLCTLPWYLEYGRSDNRKAIIISNKKTNKKDNLNYCFSSTYWAKKVGVAKHKSLGM